MSEHAVTVLVSRTVKPGCETDFEEATSRLAAAASNFAGFLGAKLVHPGEDLDAEDTMYHIVLAFDSQAHLDAWHHSDERREGLERTQPYVEGGVSVRSLAGLGLWYQTSPLAPPRWKIAIVTWLGICPTAYFTFLLTGDLLRSWNLFPRTVVITMAVVAAMTWVVAPRLTRLLRFWLFRR